MDWALFAMLVGGSAVAIAILTLIMHLLGRSRRLMVATAEEAAALFADDYPGLSVNNVNLNERGTMALLTFEQEDRIGVLRAMGTHWMTRLIGPGDVASVHRTAKGALKIVLHDFADPVITIRLRETNDTERWVSLLSGLTASAERAV